MIHIALRTKVQLAVEMVQFPNTQLVYSTGTIVPIMILQGWQNVFKNSKRKFLITLVNWHTGHDYWVYP